jgi:hypothetical protein
MDMEVKAQPQNNFEKLLSDSEFNRFGLIAVILTVVGCLGGIAVGLGAIESTVALTAVIIPTMATLSLLLAVAPMRYILTATGISLFIDIALILFYSFT